MKSSFSLFPSSVLSVVKKNGPQNDYSEPEQRQPHKGERNGYNDNYPYLPFLRNGKSLGDFSFVEEMREFSSFSAARIASAE